jgi:polyhydroxyalkanoate synthesis repressor PhaR
MPVIKRYSNRKLYDTEAKHYVTLEDLARFVRDGEEVQVVDYTTGEDLTSLTLLQVLFEEEKKMGVLFPQVFLARLIRAGDESFSTLRGRLISMDPFQVVDEEIRWRIRTLVDQGQMSPEEAEHFQDLLARHPAPEAGTRIPVKDEEGAPVTEAAAVSPEDEPADPQQVEALRLQVEMLEQQLEQI